MPNRHHGRSSRPFRLIEVESWPECREIVVEGRIDSEAIGEFEDSLLRVLARVDEWHTGEGAHLVARAPLRPGDFWPLQGV